MLTVVIGVILAGLCIWRANYFKWTSDWKVGGYSFLTVISLGITLCICLNPIYGYEEPAVVSERELLNMVEGDNSPVYVYEFANDVWLFKYIPKDEYAMYEGCHEIDLLRANVKVTESESCTKPILIKYEANAKSGLFSFGVGVKTEYEFIVPIGTHEKTNTVLN